MLSLLDIVLDAFHGTNNEPDTAALLLPNVYELYIDYLASVVYGQEFLATLSEFPGSIPGSTRLSEFHWVWNGVHSAS
jgi:hypothetical protein